MSEHTEDSPAEEEESTELTEPQIQQEIEDSDEWMQKGLHDSDPPEDDGRLREQDDSE